MNDWREEFDKEFEVVTEIEFGHQHFQKLPTPDKFKSFIRQTITEVIESIPNFKPEEVLVKGRKWHLDMFKAKLKDKYGIK